MANTFFKNARINPVTGNYDYFFPMEIVDPADKEFARLKGLEIGQARLGFRCFEAIFVPCKDKAIDEEGKEVYVDTPSEVQYRRYLDFIKDELKEQDAAKQDGRCSIPDGNGGTKRCPCRMPNLNYKEGGDAPKTLPVKCEGCVYEPYRQAHTTIPLSTLDHVNEDGETVDYEASAPAGYFEAERYERMRAAFLVYIKEHNDKLTDLASLLTLEYNRSEAADVLGKATSTVASRKELLKDLCKQFLDSTIIM